MSLLVKKARALACTSAACLGWLPLLLCVALAFVALGFFREYGNEAGGLSTMDYLVGACSPSAGFSLLWMACPAASMLVLTFVWRRRDSANLAVRQQSAGALWLSYEVDVTVVSLVATVTLVAALVAFGTASGLPFCDFEREESMFSQYAQGATMSLAPAEALPVVLAYCFAVLLFLNSAFCLLRLLLHRTVLPFALVVVAGVPSVHGTYSFVYDIAHNIAGGSLVTINPLSVIYDTASVGYVSWLPESGHNLLFLVAFCLVIAVLGARLARRAEFF